MQLSDARQEVRQLNNSSALLYARLSMPGRSGAAQQDSGLQMRTCERLEGPTLRLQELCGLMVHPALGEQP